MRHMNIFFEVSKLKLSKQEKGKTVEVQGMYTAGGRDENRAVHQTGWMGEGNGIIQKEERMLRYANGRVQLMFFGVLKKKQREKSISVWTCSTVVSFNT